jgi:ribosomal 50S subunit-recycling heat shock protein
MVCEKQLVRVNGQHAKPSKHVSIGDIIDIEAAIGVKRYRVLMIPAGNVKKGDRVLYYEEIS